MIKDVYIQPVYVENMPEEIEEGKLYISKKWHTCIHLCACGCKQKTVTPLQHDNGPFDRLWWRLIEDENGVSLEGSIGQGKLPCQSHYIIKNNIANDC